MVSFPPVSPLIPYTPPSPHPSAPHAQPISFFLHKIIAFKLKPMYARRNAEGRVGSHCCNGTATMRSPFIVAILVALNIVKYWALHKNVLWRIHVAVTLSFASKISLHFCPILTKFGISQRNFIQVSNVKLRGNPSSVSRADTYRQTDVTYRTDAFCCYENSPTNWEGNVTSQ